MYGLDPDTDVSALAGCMLTFVGFGQHQLQLAFSGATDCSISVEGEYIVSDGSSAAAVKYTDAADGAQALLRLLGRTVGTANVPYNGTVRIDFNEGSVVEVLDSSSKYESYQLNLGPRLLIV